MHASNLVALIGALAGVTIVVGCEKKPSSPSGQAPTPTAGSPAGGHHGKVIELGTATAGAYSVRASRDEGEIKPGGDAPIDVWVTGGPAKVVGVRFWIGSGDAKGSIKAKAEIEIPAEPDHWHTHAEIPDPMPAGSKLWVEIEDEKGMKHVASFDFATH